MTDANLVFKKIISASELAKQYPSVWQDDYKRRLFNISCPEGCVHSGELRITRWNAWPLPEILRNEDISTDFVFRNDTFQYETNSDDNRITWYLNFADGDLFLSYGSELMAQDEHQVAEHPILGSVREMLSTMSETDPAYEPCTRDYNKTGYYPPTPILIMGAERRLVIDTSANPDEGRPDGLYGNLFRATPWETIEKVVRRLDPPTVTNIIAMEAPSRGKAEYTLDQVTDTFRTAFSAFTAAKIESMAVAGEGCEVEIHTGNWGTGAYGGNKVLMAYLQLLSAAAAKVDRLVFHSQDGAHYHEAQKIFADSFETDRPGIELANHLKELADMRFQWGVSDGN
jgi:hypothetical protein